MFVVFVSSILKSPRVKVVVLSSMNVKIVRLLSRSKGVGVIGEL